MPSDMATPTRRSARVNATASTSTTPVVPPSQNLRKRARPVAAEPLPSKSTPLKAAKRRKLTEEPVVEDVKGKGRAKAMLPPPPPAPERPNHRKRKSMSALDDAVVLKKDLLLEAEVEVPAGRRTRKKQKSEEGVEDEPRKTRATAAKTVETPAATRKAKVQPARPPTVRRMTRSLHAAPATPALPITTTTTVTATANPPQQPPSPALSALSSLPPSPSTSPTQIRSMPPPLSLAAPLPPVSANAVVQQQTDAVAPTTQRITRYAEKKEEAPSRAGSPTPSTRSPLSTSAVLEAEESPPGKGKKGKGRAKAEAKQQPQGTKRKRGSPAPATPIRRSTRLHPGAEVAASTSTTPAASSPLAAHPVASASSSKASAPPRSTATSPSIPPPPLSLSLAQLSPPQVTQRHQGHHGGPRSSPVSPLAPPHESLPPVTPPLPSTNLTTTNNPLAAESSVSTVTASTPSSPTRSPQMTLDRMDFGTVNLPSMGSIPTLSLGPSSLGFGSGSSSGNGGAGKKAPSGSGNSPRTSPLLRPMVPSALGLGMVTAGEISPVAERMEEVSIARITPSILSGTPTPATEESRPIVDAPSPTPTSTSKVSEERGRSPSPAPSQQSTLSDQPQVSSSPPLPSPLQDGALLPQLPLTSTVDASYSSVVEEQPRPTTPTPFAQPQQMYTQRYELYQDTQTTPMDGQFRPSSPAPEQVHHHTPPPLHTHTYSLADALGSPPPSPVQMHHSEDQAPIPVDGLAQIQLPEGVQQIQIPEATPQEIVQLQQQQSGGGLVQVQLEAAPQAEQGQEMQVAAPVPLPVSATTPPPQVAAAAYQPVWEEPPRLDTEKNLWRLACKVRVWDLRRRYSPEAIRALVTQEAHEYYEKHGFPIGYFNSSRSAAAGPSSLRNTVAYGGQPVSASYTPASSSSASSSAAVVGGSGKEDGSSPGTSPVGLHFMDEPVYDWEINSNSDDEDDLEAEFDEEDYEDDDVDEEDGKAEEKTDAAEVKGKGKAKEVVQGEQPTKSSKRSPRKKRKLEADASTPKKRAASAPTPGTTLDGDGEKDMEVESEEDEDLEEVNTDTTPTPTAASPTSEQQQQHQLDAEAQAEEEARRRDLDEALADPSFNLELSSPTATSPTTLAFGESGPGRERSLSPSSPSTSPGGAFTAFYVPPAPRTVGMYGGTLDASGEPAEPTVEQDMEGGYQETPPQSITPPPASPLQVHLQMPMSPILEIPPPRLSTVPVWALRSMDMMVGGSMGRGTPVDKERKMEWITVAPRYSSPTPMSPVISAVDGGVKKEQGEGGADERDRKPILRLAMPGEDTGVGRMAAPPLHNSGGGRSGASEKMGAGLGDAPFEPSDADWAAFLADLAAGGAQSSSASSLPGPSSDPQGYSQHEYQGHPPPYTPSSSTTLSLPGQQQQQQQHPAFGMNVNMNLTNMFNMSNGVPVSGSPTTVMNFMPMHHHHHNMGHNNMMNMGGMGNLSMPPLASPMPIGVNQSPGLGVPPSMSPPHPTSAPPTPPPTSLVNVPMNMFGMGFGGNVQIGGASLQLGLTVSLTPGMGNNVGNSWFGSPPSSPPALSIGPDGNLIQDSQQQQQHQGAGSYSSPTTPTHEFDASNGMFGMGQMQSGMSGAMGVMSYGHPMNMGVAMGMGNGMGGGVAMGIRDGTGGHGAPPSPGGNGEGHDGSGSTPTSPAQTSTPSTLSFALG